MIFCDKPACGLPATQRLRPAAGEGRALCADHALKAFRALSRRPRPRLVVEALAVDAHALAIATREPRP